MFRRPNTTPLQSQHTSRHATRVRSGGPKQTTGTPQPRNFLHQQTRFAQVFENLGRSDHVKVLRRKLRLLKFTMKDCETEFAHVLSRLLRDVHPRRVPAVLARGDEQATRAATDIKQAVLLAIT